MSLGSFSRSPEYLVKEAPGTVVPVVRGRESPGQTC